MATRLRYLPLSDVSEGMVLGAPLAVTEHGVTNFTLPAGHLLTESNLRQIALRRGEFVCVEVADPRTDEERENDLIALKARLDKIFEGADASNPAVAGLYSATLSYRSM